MRSDFTLAVSLLVSQELPGDKTWLVRLSHLLIRHSLPSRSPPEPFLLKITISTDNIAAWVVGLEADDFRFFQDGDEGGRDARPSIRSCGS
jgi:hypothetical protein